MCRHPWEAIENMKNQGNMNLPNENRKSPVPDPKEMRTRYCLTKKSKIYLKMHRQLKENKDRQFNIRKIIKEQKKFNKEIENIKNPEI